MSTSSALTAVRRQAEVAGGATTHISDDPVYAAGLAYGLGLQVGLAVAIADIADGRRLLGTFFGEGSLEAIIGMLADQLLEELR